MGRDKAWVEYRGEPMAQTVAAVLGRCVREVRVVLRRGLEAPPGLPRIDDLYPQRAPIVGIHAALRACDVSGTLVTACDLPEIDPRLILALLAAWPVSGAPDILAPSSARGPEPLLAIYHPRLIPELEERIEAGRFSLQALLRDVRTRVISADTLRQLEPRLGTFRNVNRPDELR
jgi:molybdopterin-guanine dinucleotide biosynthesis protein A